MYKSTSRDVLVHIVFLFYPILNTCTLDVYHTHLYSILNNKAMLIIWDCSVFHAKIEFLVTCHRMSSHPLTPSIHSVILHWTCLVGSLYRLCSGY